MKVEFWRHNFDQNLRQYRTFSARRLKKKFPNNNWKHEHQTTFSETDLIKRPAGGGRPHSSKTAQNIAATKDTERMKSYTLQPFCREFIPFPLAQKVKNPPSLYITTKINCHIFIDHHVGLRVWQYTWHSYKAELSSAWVLGLNLILTQCMTTANTWQTAGNVECLCERIICNDTGCLVKHQ